ncbi:NADP-dependent oxidoreductase domain-containing protein [Limtongia smithiae]|uniref:NADP-dependent oxidoreductase domain-containing protein n=1 Tax=Limtongia smithiae TaxID=1125753 RepID=UPI0034CF12E9
MAATTFITKKYKLNNGLEIPAVGLGTWQGAYGTEAEDELRESIIFALKSGYRHIDSAAAYGVETVVGEAVRQSGIPREEIFIVTKLWSDYHDRAEEAFLGSLERLGLDYIDLYLMHWPASLTHDGKPTDSPTPAETWLNMEAVMKKYPTKLRSIGVSNFSKKTIDPLLETATIVPVVNQVEVHPMLPQTELIEYFGSKGIHVTAYSPLGQPNTPFFTDPTMTAIAAKYGLTPAQIILAWELQKGISIIPKSANRERIIANITLPTLAPEDVKTVDDYHLGPMCHRRLCYINHGPPTGHDVQFGWTYEMLGWDHFEVPY